MKSGHLPNKRPLIRPTTEDPIAILPDELRVPTVLKSYRKRQPMYFRSPDNSDNYEWHRCFASPPRKDDVARRRADASHLARRIFGTRVSVLAQPHLSQSQIWSHRTNAMASYSQSEYRCCHPTGRHRQGGASWLVPLAPSAYLSNIYARGLCATERAAICEAADRSGRHVASALNSRQTSATSSDRKTRLVMCHRSGDFPGLRRPSRGA